MMAVPDSGEEIDTFRGAIEQIYKGPSADRHCADQSIDRIRSRWPSRTGCTLEDGYGSHGTGFDGCSPLLITSYIADLERESLT